jgi:DNA polymerase III sliding clamp (beta) subunit (PCNA family)
MKIAATAGALADALAMATAITDEKYARAHAAPAAVYLKAGTSTNNIRIITNALDHAIAVTAPVQVEVPGEVAVASTKVSALTATLPAEIDIQITSDASVTCGRSVTKPDA